MTPLSDKSLYYAIRLHGKYDHLVLTLEPLHRLELSRLYTHHYLVPTKTEA
jgi:hypothetical protein